MRFPGFYGNDRLKQRLSASLRAGSLSHCCLISGPKGSGKKTLARCIAAAMECTGRGDRPCGACPDCRKIFGGGHPDVITIDSDRATVPISVIRDMQADAYIRPNEGARKIYILPRAQDMLPPAQNALLKILEEPPEYCTFLLLTDNADKLLSTVRSRAVEFSLFPLPDALLEEALRNSAPQADPSAISSAIEKSGGYLGAALALLSEPETREDAQIALLAESFSKGDKLSLLNALVPLEKWKRQELLTLLTQLHLVFVRAMARKSGAAGTCSAPVILLSDAHTAQTLFHGDAAILHAAEMLRANVSSGHAVGYLLAEFT